MIDDDLDRERSLSNLEVLGFIWSLWMRQPARFAGVCAFSFASTVSDLMLPIIDRKSVV